MANLGNRWKMPRRDRSNGHPSYPNVRLPAPLLDLDCENIDASHISVVGNNPHELNSNGNGLECP